MELVGRVAELVCWGVFAAVWIAGAIYNARRAPVATARGNLAGVWLLGVGAYLLMWWALPLSLWRAMSVRSDWSVGLGMALLAGGTAFTVWARVELGTMWTGTVVVKQGHRLVTSGPYRITRHPIYTGMLGMLCGTVLIEGLGRWLVVLVVATFLLVGKVRAEERLLCRELGEAYLDYRRRVPALVPVPTRPGRDGGSGV
ncbi:MAG TPA: isoprenylcysteine carboxylmethyltransferase family protein [Pseudonocardia sp.]|jgi:protein-S-isoprenylcysteine O-methyltransferase Ste14|nr:isoprenylcysteine carboxylmethyltransferase family protein [Pseudonocardia sp.]